MKEEPVAQIAALPIRWDDKRRIRILMVTSRDTGRWVMPKGWMMDGKKPWAAAEIEALEEAGAVGRISRQPIGSYHYDKLMPDGTAVRCRVRLFPMIVEKLKRNWKERDERKRRWFSPKSAARAVQEKELAELLRRLGSKADREPALKALLRAA
ncbi:MAG: NUDIX domain-containing protein [Alphaproteobacteria bacterium]|nr:MAG: NUDIX domain-containing protein [Alphaproteobacteria bacterium]